jgi:hypothetical protein
MKVVGLVAPPIDTGYGVDAVTGIIFLNSVAPAPPPPGFPPCVGLTRAPLPPPPINKISINPVVAGVKVLAPVVVKACTV